MVMYEVIFNMDPPRRNLVEEFAFCPQRYEGGLVADDVVTDLWQLLCDCVSTYLIVSCCCAKQTMCRPIKIQMLGLPLIQF